MKDFEQTEKHNQLHSEICNHFETEIASWK